MRAHTRALYFWAAVPTIVEGWSFRHAKRGYAFAPPVAQFCATVPGRTKCAADNRNMIVVTIRIMNKQSRAEVAPMNSHFALHALCNGVGRRFETTLLGCPQKCSCCCRRSRRSLVPRPGASPGSAPQDISPCPGYRCSLPSLRGRCPHGDSPLGLCSDPADARFAGTRLI